MRVLRLIDISPYIYAGNVMRHAAIEGELYNTPSGWKLEKIQTGGLSFLFNTIRDYASTSTLIFCADRKPSERQKINPEYKNNRKHSSHEEGKEIRMQKDMAEKILLDCNFNVAFCPDWESDDVMYTLSKVLYNDFDQIYLHTNDSDMHMSVVGKVEIAPVRKTDKRVTVDNYEIAAGKKGQPMEYNMCNFYKMLYGDSSDNYGGIVDYRLRERLLNTFHDPKIRLYAGDSTTFGELIKSLIPELYDQFILAYQQIVPVDVDILLKPDLEYVDVWSKLIGSNHNYAPSDTPTRKAKHLEATTYIKSLMEHRV